MPGRDPVWKALSAAPRREILDLLRAGPATTGQIAATFPVSRIATMKHLDVLAEAGLVVSRKRGRERWHYLNDVPLRAVHARWFRPFAAGWADGLLRLGAHLQEPAMDPALDIAQDLVIAAPPARVFAAFVEQTSMWWGHPYLHPDAVDLVLEPGLGGALREVLADGGGALLGHVSVWRPGRRLEVTGRLHLGVVVAVLDLRLAPADGGTHVAFTLQAVGAVPPEVQGFQQGWNELLRRLKAFAETGEALGVAAMGRKE